MFERSSYVRFPSETTLMEAEGEMPPESRLGERIKVARKFYDLSVDALARLTREYDPKDSKGVSATALHRYETGDALPGAREVRILCQALDVPSEWLIFGAPRVEGVSAEERQLILGLRSMIDRSVSTKTDASVASYQGALFAKHDGDARLEALERAKRKPTEIG